MQSLISIYATLLSGNAKSLLEKTNFPLKLLEKKSIINNKYNVN